MAVKRPRGNAPKQLGNVGFVRDEIKKLKKQYDKIRDCIDGETVVKEKTTLYLPRPNPDDSSSQNTARYTSYLERAVFYNATRRTLSGLLGEIFAVDPVIEIPDILKSVNIDATGGGVTALQQSIEATSNVLAYSRAGIFIDFPAVENPVSQEEISNGQVHPLFYVYPPWKIINWRTITRGSKVLLSLVVLEEDYEKEDDGFEIKTEKQWRVLRLDSAGRYQVDIWRVDTGTLGSPFQTYQPKDASGERLDEIPFRFIGSKNNDAKVDPPLLYDLASLNIAHYRNSADYEESVFVVGQPTYWFSGLTKDWVETVLGKRVETGSRAAIALPEKGAAGIMQPEANTMAFAAMEHKEKQMVALGAKLVESKAVQRTATEATMDVRTENSILSTAANNVSEAFTWAFKMAGKFLGVQENELIKFELNTEFAINKLTPDEQAQIIAAWVAGAIEFTEMRSSLRKSGIATMTDEQAKAAIAKDQEELLGREIKKIEAKRPPIAAGGTTNPTGATGE